MGSVCKLHRPFATPFCPLALPLKSSGEMTDRLSHLSLAVTFEGADPRRKKAWRRKTLDGRLGHLPLTYRNLYMSQLGRGGRHNGFIQAGRREGRKQKYSVGCRQVGHRAPWSYSLRKDDQELINDAF